HAFRPGPAARDFAIHFEDCSGCGMEPTDTINRARTIQHNGGRKSPFRPSCERWRLVNETAWNGTADAGRAAKHPGARPIQAWPVISQRMMMMGSGTPKSHRHPDRMTISESVASP